MIRGNMARKFFKNTLYIIDSTGDDIQSFLPANIEIDELYISQKRSNVAIIVNLDFYNKNKMYTHKVISANISDRITDIVISHSDFLKHIDSVFDITNKRPSVHFNKSCTLSKEILKDIDLGNFDSFTFESNVPFDLANELIRNSIPFYTTSTFPLLDTSKFSSDNDLITQSDYYQSLRLSISGNLTDADITALDSFFDVNRILYNISLNTDLKTSLEVVKSYVSNISKYSHAHFNVQLPDIILNKSDSTYLYEIHKLLKANKCNLSLVSPTKETISYAKYTETLSPLRKFATKLNTLNLSPIEKLILIEDYSKSRPYYDSIDKSESRNFFSSLNSDYVVCYTYAATFKALCDYTNIPCTIAMGRLTTDGGKVSEHAKVICNIVDPKYDRNGLYIFEPTFDAVQIDSEFPDEKTCDNYLYFANTYSQYNDVYTISTREFGLLAQAGKSVDLSNIEDKNECIRQLNELYGTDYSSTTDIDTIDNAIATATDSLMSAYEIDLDTFKSALSTARSSIGDFTEEDMERIIRINSYRATQSVSRCSTNRFCNDEMFEAIDDSIIVFDEF